MVEKWIILARKELGTKEAPGGADNPVVVDYYKDAGHPEIEHDSTAWCAAFVGAVLHRAGIKPSGSLMARSYLKWGQQLNGPKDGAVAVMWRGHPDSDEGHVGFVDRFDENGVMILGGNQGSEGVVSVEHFPLSRVLGYRWPIASTPKPLPTTMTRTLPMNPLSVLVSLITTVLPKDAPGTAGAGITTPIGTARSNLLSIIVSSVMAGFGVSGFGVDAMHTISTIAGVALALLSAANHLGLIGANNANTEAYAESLLKQIADAGKTAPEG